VLGPINLIIVVISCIVLTVSVLLVGTYIPFGIKMAFKDMFKFLSPPHLSSGNLVIRQRSFDFATWTHLVPESEIRALLRYAVKYYFAGGKPGVLPLTVLPRIMVEMGLEDFELLSSSDDHKVVIDHYNYAPTDGLMSLRKVLADLMIRRDYLPLDKEEGWKDVIITTGSQQAIYAIMDVLIDPGDVVIVPRPVYLGFVNVAVKFGARVITVPQDKEGVDPEHVDKAIEESKKRFGKVPDIIYVVPDSDNPTGTTMPEKRRKDLFEVAASHGSLIVEDAAYREIQFGDQRIRPIKAFDKENSHVIYMRTTSKEVAVVRVGYSVMPKDVAEQVIKVKGYLDLCTPVLCQRFARYYYERYFEREIDKVRKEYEKRCRVMAKAIDESFPEGERTDPKGGFFIWWSSKRKDFDSKKFLDIAIKEDVAYVPGQAFYPSIGMAYQPGVGLSDNIVERNGMRLGYSYLSPEEIEEGINRLGSILRRHLG
jgi:2-aminoadipate transaminase